MCDDFRRVLMLEAKANGRAYTEYQDPPSQAYTEFQDGPAAPAAKPKKRGPVSKLRAWMRKPRVSRAGGVRGPGVHYNEYSDPASRRAGGYKP